MFRDSYTCRLLTFTVILQGLITEETLPTNYHPYATSKLAGEKVVLHSASLGTMKTIVLRLSNIVGSALALPSAGNLLQMISACKLINQIRY